VPRGTPFVTVNGAPATLEPDGVTFTAPLALAEGGNEIRAQAFPFGQEDSVRVTLDTVPPALELLFPEDGTLTGDAEVAFAGFVSEAGRVEAVGPGGAAAAATQTRVLAPGNELFGIQPILEFVFELPLLALVDGPNPIDLRLVDRAGNESLVPLTLRRSSAALVLESPAAGSALPDLRTDLVLRVLEDVTLEALFSAGRRVPGFAGIALSAGALPPATATLSGVPLAPGTTELRLVYRRDATGEREVLSFALESLATEVATVAGIVTDSQTGNPLEGALVTVVVNGLELVVPSGPDGRFALPVEPGDVQVVVRREGFVDLVVDGMPGAGETFVADANLIPWSVQSRPIPTDPSPGTTSTVAGTVTDLATGDPLEGALVLITQDGVQLSAITEASGGYAIGEIPVGGFEVTITRVGFFPQVFTISTSEPVEVPLDVALEPIPDTVTLVGTVTSGLSGTVEPGVEVTVLGTDRIAVTDEAGAYLLEGVPTGLQSIRLRKGGFADLYLTFDDLRPPLGGGPLVQDFTYPVRRSDGRTLAVPPDATGSVRDLFSGQPLAGAAVRADGQTVVVDAEGRFAFADLPPQTLLTFTAEAPEHEPQSISALVVEQAEGRLDFALTSQQRGFVSGTLRDALTGAPIAAAEIQVPGAPLLATATDAEGTYRLVGVPPGTHVLQVTHPEYLPDEALGVAVTAGEETVVDAVLVPRPRTGALQGRVTDASDGSPIEGALLTAPGGLSATTDADGNYRLEGLPAGFVRLALEAPGLAPTTRATTVTADRAPGTLSVTEADFALAADGAVPDDVTQLVHAEEGGVIRTPDRRFAALILPGSLSADARLTLRSPEPPPVANGTLLDLDPALGLDAIEAVGEATELLVEAPVEGEVAPVLEGPVALIVRFSEADREAAGVAERGMFPYYFDGARWTALRIVPHLHAVDRINNLLFVVLDPRETEIGTPVVARLETPRPVLLAQVGDDPPDFRLVRRFLFQAASRALEALGGDPQIAKSAEFIDFGADDSPLRDAIDPNALPLFVVHGWNPLAILDNVDLTLNPLGDPRYGPMLEDLIAGTEGVYRPIFLTYNSRLSPLVSGNLLGETLLGPLLAGGIRGQPAPGDPDSGRFSVVNSFGFSMGGLVERALSCFVPDIADMVSLGSPHHGALQRVVSVAEAVAGTVMAGQLDIREVFREWSPGTVALLDYEDGTGEGNPTLFLMNERMPCTVPKRTLGLIGGTESGILDDLVFVGETPNDKVVPLRSAHAEEKRSGTTVLVVAGLVEDLRKRQQPFNHLDVGTIEQPISAFAAAEIFPVLSDWTVALLERFEFLPEDPEPDEPVRVEAEVTVSYNVPHGNTTGVTLLLYVQDGNGDWRIEDGADPATRQAEGVVSISGNSIDPGKGPVPLRASTELPVPDPEKPETLTQDVQIVVFPVTNGETTVPPEPEANFELPGG